MNDVVGTKPHRLRRAVLWIIACAAVLGGTAWLLSVANPSRWIDPRIIAEDEESDRRSRELEQNLPAAISRIRPVGEPWIMRIRDVDINAWIALRMPKWQQHDPSLAWPIEGATAQVEFGEGCVTIRIAAHQRIWSGTFTPTVEAGSIHLDPGWGAVGMLPVPGGASLASRLMEGDAAKNLSLPSIFKLGDGRQVEVRRIDLVGGAVEIECVTR